MNNNNVSFIRITNEALVELKMFYNLIEKQDSNNPCLSYSSCYEESHPNKEYSCKIECDYISVGDWGKERPHDVVKINIDSMEFYVYPDLKDQLCRSTIDLLRIFTSDGKYKVTKFILQNSTHINTSLIEKNGSTKR